MDLKELENGINPEVHWYYQSKKLPLLAYTKKALAAGEPLTIVDIGAGSGFFALELEKLFGEAIRKVYLVDTGYSAEEMAPTRGAKIEKVHAIPSQIENGLVIMMDVLEHLESDLQMLQSVKAACVGNHNYFFITVPAFQTLWSRHDVFLGHYRRYRIPMLRQTLQLAGFRKIHNYYLYGGLFPLVWTMRQVDNLTQKAAASNMRPFTPLANKLLLRLSAAEMKIAPANKWFGVSCVGEGQI